MIVRVLPANEWHRLDATDPLIPGQDVVYAVEDGDRILGWWPIHSLLVGGEMFVVKEHRGNGVADMLAAKVNEDLRTSGNQLFTVIRNPHAEKLAKASGMVEIQGKLFRKDVV